MSKRIVRMLALAGVLSLAAVPLSVSAAGNPNPTAFQIQISSGGIPVPGADEPVDGITSGIHGGLGECVPNIHTFYNQVPGEHIVFTVRANPRANNKEKVTNIQDATDVNITAEVYSGDKLVAEVPVNILHEGEHADWLTGDSFYTGCLFLKNQDGIDILPTGDYTYKFKATATYNFKHGNPVSQVVSEWVPENNTITVKELP